MASIGASLPPAFIPVAVPVAAPVVAPVVAGVVAAALLPEIGGALAVVGLGVALGVAAKFLWGLLANNRPIGLIDTNSSFENISDSAGTYRAWGSSQVATSAVWYSGGGGYFSSGAVTTSTPFDKTVLCYGMRVTLGSASSECVPPAGPHNITNSPIVTIETRDANGNWSINYQVLGANGQYHDARYSWTRKDTGTAGQMSKGGVALLPKTVPLHRPPSFVPLLEPIKQPDKKKEPIPLISPVLPEAEPVTQPAPPLAPPATVPEELSPRKRPVVVPMTPTKPRILPLLIPEVSTTKDGAIVPQAPAPVATTPPDAHFPVPGAPPVTGNGPRPSPEGIAQELGRLEQKLARLSDPGPGGPGDGTDRLQLLFQGLAQLVDFLTAINLGGGYSLSSPCVLDENDERIVSTVEYAGAPTTLGVVMNKIDALAALIQVHKDLKQPNCTPKKPVGQPVTVNFVQVD